MMDGFAAVVGIKNLAANATQRECLANGAECSRHFITLFIIAARVRAASHSLRMISPSVVTGNVRFEPEVEVSRQLAASARPRWRIWE